MAHYLTFPSLVSNGNCSVTCIVNGTSVSSGYELHDGDEIIIYVGAKSGVGLYINNEYCADGGSVDVYDSNVEITEYGESGGGSTSK